MGIVSGLVLYAVFWFITFLVAIPIRLQTQGDVGIIEPGTHAGSPAIHNLKRKAWITTAVAAVLWAMAAFLIIYSDLTVADLGEWSRTYLNAPVALP